MKRLRFSLGKNGGKGGTPTVSSVQNSVGVAATPAHLPSLDAGTKEGGGIMGSLRDAISMRAYSGRAELRHHNVVLKLIIIALVIALIYNNHSWSKAAGELANKQWVVFHDTGMETIPRLASEYRTGPSDAEIKHKAWDFLRWVATISSNNVDTAFAEVKPMMTKEMATQFEKAMGPKKEEIRQLGAYKIIRDATVRRASEMKPEELPPGLVDPGPMQVLIYGTLDTYRMQTNELIATGPFVYLIDLVPTPTRTIENPYGLLVASINKFDPPSAPKPKEQPRQEVEATPGR